MGPGTGLLTLCLCLCPCLAIRSSRLTWRFRSVIRLMGNCSVLPSVLLGLVARVAAGLDFCLPVYIRVSYVLDLCGGVPMLGKRLVAALAAGASLFGLTGFVASASAVETPATQTPATQSSVTLRNAQFGHVYSAYKVGELSAKSVDAKTGYASGVAVKTVADLVPALSSAAGGDLPKEYKCNPLAWVFTKVSTLTDQGGDNKNSSGKENTGDDARMFSDFMGTIDSQARDGYTYTLDGGGRATITYTQAATSGVVQGGGDVVLSGLDAASVYLVTDTYDRASLGREGKAGVPLVAATTGVKVNGEVTAAVGFSVDNLFPNTVFTKSVVLNKKFKFRKVDALNDRKVIAGVKFRVTGGPLADGDHRDFVSDENGWVTISLPYSSRAYVVTELEPVDGYKGFFDASHASISVTFTSPDDHGTFVDGTQCSAANGQTEHCVHAGDRGWGFDPDYSDIVWRNVPDSSHFPATGFLGNMAMVAGAAVMVVLAGVVAKVSRKRSVEA